MALPALARRRMSAALIAGTTLLALSGCSGDDDPPVDARQASTFGSTHCAADAECVSPTVELGETSLVVTGDASEFSQTVSVELVDDQELHCPGDTDDHLGAVAIFSNTVPDAEKTITYTLTGDAADNARTAFETHPEYFGCYAAPVGFNGVVDGDRSEAEFVEGDGLFEAQLLSCDDVDFKPCFSFEDSGTDVTVTIQAPPGDPRTVG